MTVDLARWQFATTSLSHFLYVLQQRVMVPPSTPALESTDKRAMEPALHGE